MTLDPELARFQQRLESAGTVVAAHADHLCVRLPMLISLRVRYDGERLAFDPRFGIVSRGVATAAIFGIMNAAIVGALVAGAPLPVLITLGAIGALGTVYETLRYVVTEAAITRVAMLWGTRADPRGPGALGAGAAEPIRAGRAAERERVRIDDD